MTNDFFMKNGLPGEQNLFNRGMRLEITHMPTDYSVAFSAFLDQFSDAYNSEWNEEYIYGRMDPIGGFQQTRRNISVAWRIPASSLEQAKDNLDKMNKVVSFLYPRYGQAGVSQASFIEMGPYWKVKFGNLICNSLTGGPLIGWVNGITVDPLFEEGTFMLDYEASSEASLRLGRQRNLPTDINYYPKAYRLNFEMTVIHEHSVGWKRSDAGGEFIFRGKMGKSTEGKSFPYPSFRRLQDPIDEIDPSVGLDLNDPAYSPQTPPTFLFDQEGNLLPDSNFGAQDLQGHAKNQFGKFVKYKPQTKTNVSSAKTKSILSPQGE